MTIIDDTAVAIPYAGLIQNLGPGAIYVGDSAVAPATGFRVAAGEALAVGTATSTIYAVSDGTSDVRAMSRATGIFSIEIPA